VNIVDMHNVYPSVDLLLRAGLALLLGVAIGLERQFRSRMAGLQTMALVSMGSALFTIMGAYDFPTQGDRNRVAAGIVTGIGFLGAGVIIKEGMTVIGLNTAATLWVAGAVGALCGVWMWREALVGTLLVIVGNGLLYPMSKWIDSRPLKPSREKRGTDF
jgi:putative Mg2+ transporter-C (MgtC) family protein